MRLCFRLPIKNEKAIHTAYYFFLGSLGCALGPSKPYCKKILGSIVQGASVKDGVRIPSTLWELDPYSLLLTLRL